MKKSEAVLLSAYTGYMLTKDFSAVHAFIEKTLDRPVFVHDLDCVDIYEELRSKLLPQLTEMVGKEEDDDNELC